MNTPYSNLYKHACSRINQSFPHKTKENIFIITVCDKLSDLSGNGGLKGLIKHSLQTSFTDYCVH